MQAIIAVKISIMIVFENISITASIGNAITPVIVLFIVLALFSFSNLKNPSARWIEISNTTFQLFYVF